MEIEDFLKYKPAYSPIQEGLVGQEFLRLNENCYLDHAGATLYSEKQMESVFQDLSTNIYANPHSLHISSKSTEDAIDIVRYQILEHFNTSHEEYSVIFTSGTTASLKLVAECFDYGDDSKGTFAYLENNHTSVLGMRNFAENHAEIKTEDAFKHLSGKHVVTLETTEDSNSLFVYPAQCNFSGTKYPLKWIDQVKKGSINNLIKTKSKNWYVLLDAPCYVATNELDLSRYKPDFVPISFYKIFGYPTGVGALLVKKSSEGLLKKRYFGGGSVLMALSSQNIMVPRIILHEKFEDGTLPFLSILAIKHGFDAIKRMNLNFDLMSQHTFSLARYVYRHLLTLHHSNGKPAVILYHDTLFQDREHQGGIINFTLLRPNGEHIGYSEVLHMANLHGIHLRTGCHCNPGACQRFLKLQVNDVLKHFNAGHVCGDQNDLVDGYPTGTVRISFGYMSTKEDANKFLKMIEYCFVSMPIMRRMPSNWNNMKNTYDELFHEKSYNTIKEIHEISNDNKIVNRNNSTEGTSHPNTTVTGILQQILIYPIKSCGALSVSKMWTVTSKGLKFDRQWMIINAVGVCLTQKQNRKLCLIRPYIDLKKNVLKLKFKGHPDIVVDLDLSTNEKRAYLCQSKICGDRVQGWDCGDEISDWLSECLEMPGLRLLRQYQSEEETIEDTTPHIFFANKAQYLLINSTSVDWLVKKIPNGELNEDLPAVIQRFRPNFVVKFDQPFVENEIEELSIDNIKFKTTGKCTRCQMICIDQNSGGISKEPLLTLSRELKGKIHFGIYLSQKNYINDQVVSIESDVIETITND